MEKKKESNDIDHGNKNIAFATILGYVSLILSAVSGLLLTPLISSTFGKSLYGVYTLASSMVSLFFIDLGLSTTARVFVAKLRSEGKKEEVNRLSSTIFQLYFIIDLFVIIALIIVYFSLGLLYKGLTQDEIGYLRILFLIYSFYSVVAFPSTALDGFLAAYERFVWLKIAEIINRLFCIIFSLLAVYFKWPIYALAIATSCSGFFAILIKIAVLIFCLQIKISFFHKIDKIYLRSVFSFSFWNALISICWRLSTMLSPSVLGIISNSENIAVFGVASTIESYAFSICGIFNGLFSYKIARIYTTSSPEEASQRIEALASKVGKIISSILLLIIVGFISCGQDFIVLWMKDEAYSQAFFCVLIVLCSEGTVFPNLVLRNSLYFNNNIKYLALAQCASTVVYVSLSFVLGFFYGAFGVSAAIGVSEIVLLFGTSLCYVKRLHVNLWRFFKNVYGRQVFSFFPSLVAGLLLNFLLPSFSHLWIKFLIEGSVAALIYISLLLVFVFSKSEKREIMSLIRRQK